MSLSRAVARPLLASVFISGGLDAMRHPESKVAAAQAVTDELRTWVPSLPEDTATLVKVNGMVQFGAGLLLALGKVRRVAALALIGSLLPTTYAGHRFWEESDEGNRAQQRSHFLKNLGLLGGLILALVDTEGAPSIGWRARRKVHRVSHAVAMGRATTGSGAHRVSAKAATTGRRANKQAHRAAAAAWESADVNAHRAASKAGATGRRARRAAGKAAARANKARVRGGQRANRVLADTVTSGVALATPYMQHANESVHTVARALREGAEPALTALREGVDPLLTAGMEQLEELQSKVAEHRDH
jgi:uncharacterized membrane protein YphA (DoxX/SURF4 family)